MDTIARCVRGLWRLLGSARLAALLMAALLLTTLLASLFPQMPSDPAAQAPWLSAVALRYRNATGLLRALGIFDVYHAPWYLALLVALLLNALACTIQRLPRFWRSLTRPPKAARPDAFYQGFAHRTGWAVPSQKDGVESAEQCLLRRRYRVHAEFPEGADCTYIFAERGRWTQAGTVLSHVAALCLVLAVTARPALAWQETGVSLLPGQVHTIALTPPLTVAAGPLTVDHHPSGQPRDLRVPLTILVDGAPTMTRTVRINHPFTYRGVAFHLHGYGPGAQLETPEGSFDLAFSESQAEEVALPKAGLSLRLAYQPQGEALFVETMTADGTILGSGTVVDGQEINAGGTPISFTVSPYTVWQVSHDPTFALAVVSAAFLLAGTVISLWIPHRRLWIRVDGQTAQMVGAGDFGRDLADSFEALSAEITADSGAASTGSAQVTGATLKAMEKGLDG
jgi:cytochrome c biogenesis protein